VVAHQPDVLVVDTQMPGPGVAELVRLVGKARPATRVLLLDEDAHRPANGQAPAPAALAGTTRAVSARELAAAIRAVAEGHAPHAAPIAAAAEPQPAPAAAPVHVVAGRDGHAELLLRSLSGRERQILTLLCRGHSNRRIAESCQVSISTVRTHVQNVLIKLGVHSKLEAVALVVRRDGDGR